MFASVAVNAKIIFCVHQMREPIIMMMMMKNVSSMNEKMYDIRAKTVNIC